MAKPSKSIFVLALVAGLGIAFTLTATYAMVEREDLKISTEIERRAENHFNALRHGIETHVQQVELVRDLFGISDRVSHKDFDTFLGLIDAHFGGFDTKSWAPRVPGEGRAAFESTRYGEAGVGAKIKRLDQDGKVEPSETRDQYFPIQICHPTDVCRKYMGLDLGSFAQSALDLTRDTGQPALVRHLFHTPEGDKTITLIVVSSYRRGLPLSSREERRDALRGYFVSSFALDDVVETILRRQTASAGLDIFLFDDMANTPDHLLYMHASRTRDSSDKIVSIAQGDLLKSSDNIVFKRMAVADRTWKVYLRATPHTVAELQSAMPETVLGFGAFATILLTAYARFVQTRFRNVETLVAKRTNKLQETSTALERELVRRLSTEQKLRAANERGEQASRAKSEFLSSMSHELRTPMNAVLGFAQLLTADSEAPLVGKQTKYVEQILSSGSHMIDLINQILNFSAADKGDFAANITAVEPKTIIAECVALAQSLAMARGDLTLIDLSTGRDLPRFMVEPLQFRQVLINLLSNAIKYNRPEGQVSVDCIETGEGTLRVSVSDDGPGIPENQQARLFKPFDRLGRETSNIEGTGIGLSLTLKLVEQMNGTLGYETGVGVGSTFWCEFPTATAAADVAGVSLPEGALPQGT